MTTQSAPVWRSLLFIPANNQKFVGKAHTRGADGIILDLEDSVAPEQKAAARLALPAAARQVAANGIDVLVRVNAEWLPEDIQAAATAAVRALLLPKVNTAAPVLKAAALLDRLEGERGLPPGSIRLLAQIEDVQALPNLDAIASSTPRLLGMSLGSEDFSASAAMLPLPETLYGPNQQVVFACRRAGILPFGFPASITLFSDLDALQHAAIQATAMGFVGAFCIHPKQVPVLNQAFTPASAAVLDARTLLAEFARAEAEGRGVFAFKGKMVDLPVILRARELVARAEAIAATPAR
ncbi:MAG: CoA ester lyase [Gammaproteobacteria bacterium]|nr:CoA ester lyase [Gammaproteobacteria bacterium]